MTDSWEIVKQRPEKRRKQPRLYISLNRRGEIAMNAAAFRAIGQPASVTLLYDAKTRRMGVKSPVAIDRHFFPVRHAGRGGRTLIVSAARMLKQFGIEVSTTRVFRDVRCVRFEGEPMLLLSLDEAVSIIRSARFPDTKVRV